MGTGLTPQLREMIVQEVFPCPISVSIFLSEFSALSGKCNPTWDQVIFIILSVYNIENSGYFKYHELGSIFSPDQLTIVQSIKSHLIFLDKHELNVAFGKVQQLHQVRNTLHRVWPFQQAFSVSPILTGSVYTLYLCRDVYLLLQRDLKIRPQVSDTKNGLQVVYLQ